VPAAEFLAGRSKQEPELVIGGTTQFGRAIGDPAISAPVACLAGSRDRLVVCRRSHGKACAGSLISKSICRAASNVSRVSTKTLIAKLVRASHASNPEKSDTYDFLIANPARGRFADQIRAGANAANAICEIRAGFAARCAKLFSFFQQESPSPV